MSMCPCNSNLSLDSCCAPILAGTPALTAESLVRSRYTAFVMRNLDHVERTHAPEVRADFNRAEAERLAEECEWQSLQIHSVKETGDTADIEFVVRLRKDQKIVAKAASSHFRRDNGEWLFVSSNPVQHIAHRRTVKIGRNDPCHCNSGKKYKKCCANTTELRVQ
jgi:SEC-C motif domain protein